MAAKTTLDAKYLETLGPKRLAELLIEISSGNTAAKRRLRLELAGARSPGELGMEVRKRLTVIARSRSFVDWQGIRSLVNDLEAQRRAIVETVARADPEEASTSTRCKEVVTARPTAAARCRSRSAISQRSIRTSRWHSRATSLADSWSRLLSEATTSRSTRAAPVVR